MQYNNDYRPEHCTQFSINAFNTPSIKKPTKPQHFLDRPGFLLKAPVPLNVKVSIIEGPERIASGWWDNKEIQRDYFLAQSDQGQQMWVFRTLDDSWYVHGYFI